MSGKKPDVVSGAGDKEFFAAIAAEGGYPLSENMGAAPNWLGEDGIPRPDCKYDTLWWLSFLGFLGIDHFYVRSPLTGTLKLLTLGGLGVWWAWDLLQLSFEKARVIKYGMTTPFDWSTGIGQGMITDKAMNYESDTSFSAWIFGVIFGFIGVDAFALGKYDQGVRKILEFTVFVISCLWAKTDWDAGGVVGAGFCMLFAIILGLIIVPSYAAVFSKVFLGPRSVFKTGIVETEEKREKSNSIMEQVIKACNYGSFAPGLEDYMIKQLEYGDLTATELRERFVINRLPDGEAPRLLPKKDKEPFGMAFMASLGLIFSPIALIVRGLYELFKLVKLAFMPDTRVFQDVAGIKLPNLNFGDSGALTAALPAAQNAVAASVQTKMANPLLGLANPLPGLASTLPGTGQAGGAHEEPLSVESKVMGAVIVALVAGGSLKGLVDYLMAE